MSAITKLAASMKLANYPAVTAFGVATHRSQLKARTPLACNAGHSAARSVAKALRGSSTDTSIYLVGKSTSQASQQRQSSFFFFFFFFFFFSSSSSFFGEEGVFFFLSFFVFFFFLRGGGGGGRLTLYRQVPGRVATGVPIFKSLVWPRKNPGANRFRTRDLTLTRRTKQLLVLQVALVVWRINAFNSGAEMWYFGM